ncbi:MAG: aldo/keto reductase [Terriglobia bacterium]
MEYRVLGKTGLRVSKIGFGASPLGGIFKQIDEDEGIRAVHAAVEAGIHFIDCSPFYGITRAESVLGRALKDIPRDKYYLATKVGRYGDAEFDFSTQRVTASVDESLRRLNVDWVDLIQCHDIEFGSLDQVIQETLPALRKVVQQGKARFVGITGLPLKILHEVIDRASVDTILSYCHYALNDAALEFALPHFEASSIGVISFTILHGTSDAAGTSCLVPSTQGDQGRLCATCRTFPGERRRYRPACTSVFPVQPQDPYDAGWHVQPPQSGEKCEGRGHTFGSGSDRRSTENPAAHTEQDLAERRARKQLETLTMRSGYIL